jgi:hypothetical protein
MMKQFSRLYPALLLGVFCGILGALAAYWGVHEAERARQGFERHSGQLRQIMAERAEFQKNAAEWRQLGQRFQELQEQGFFAQAGESRPDWEAYVRETGHQQEIFTLHYEFGPEQPLAEYPDYFMSAPLSLSLELNHELELMPFLQALSAHPQALARVQECEMQRNPARPASFAPGPNILARCKLEWITGHLPRRVTP